VSRQQVVRRDVIFEIEEKEQLLLSTACSTHHRISPLAKASGQHTEFVYWFFNAIGRKFARPIEKLPF
jgi:hypothetical protein